MGAIDISAILWGLALGLALSFGIGMVLAIVTGVGIAARDDRLDDMDEDEFARHYLEHVTDTQFLLGLVIISLLVNALAGYLTARLAAAADYLNAGIMGALAVLLSLVLEKRTPVMPAWGLWLWTLLGVPFALIGAWIANQ